MLITALERHILFTEYDAVRHLCLPLNKLNICGFIYMRTYPDGSFIDLSNQLGWTTFFLDKYLGEKYDVAPIENHMFINAGVTLWNAYPDNIIWQEGIQHFSYGNGISICFSKRKYKEIFCFYSKANNYSINQFYINHLDVLKSFCEYFREKMSATISTAENQKNILLTPKCYKKKSFDKKISARDPVMTSFLEEINSNADDALTSLRKNKELSARELECVKWSAMGHSAKKIAGKLFLSPRTIETHLCHAKEKLNCANLKELISAVSRTHSFSSSDFLNT